MMNHHQLPLFDCLFKDSDQCFDLNQSNELFLYKIEFHDHVAYGLVGLFSIDSLKRSFILPHEKTSLKQLINISKDLENSLTIRKPILLLHDHDELESLLQNIIIEKKTLIFQKPHHGIIHSIYKIKNSELIHSIKHRKHLLSSALIADGHHRLCLIDQMYRKNRRNPFFAGALFHIKKFMTFHRLIHLNLSTEDASQFLIHLHLYFDVKELIESKQLNSSDNILVQHQGRMYELFIKTGFLANTKNRKDRLEKFFIYRKILKTCKATYFIKHIQQKQFEHAQDPSVTQILIPKENLHHIYQNARKRLLYGYHTTYFYPRMIENIDDLTRFSLPNPIQRGGLSTSDSIFI